MSVSVEALEAALEEGGERERLKELLRQRLKETGWSRSVSEECSRVVRERGGVESLSVPELITAVTPFARKSVPNDVKKELLNLIRDFLQKQTGISDF